jgi:hypothetical protein
MAVPVRHYLIEGIIVAAFVFSLGLLWEKAPDLGLPD